MQLRIAPGERNVLTPRINKIGRASVSPWSGTGIAMWRAISVMAQHCQLQISSR
jgi:hypothetical protein